MKTEFTGDDIYHYCKQWYDEENWSDLNRILDMSQILGMEYLCHYLVCKAGAIDSSLCYPEARAIEREIERLAGSFDKLSPDEQRDYREKTFNGCHTFTCSDCNHVSFVADGNHKFYKDELRKCWDCGSENVTQDIYELNESDVDTFYESYVETALWSSTAYGYIPEGETAESESTFEAENFDESDLSEKTRKEMYADCRAFILDNWDDIKGDLSRQAMIFG